MEQTPSTTQPTEQQPPLQNPQPPPAAVSTSTTSLPPPSTTTTSFPNSNPTTTPQSQQQSTTSQTRPPFNTRPWQQPPYSHFSLPPSPLPSSSAPPPSSISAPQPPRGGMAIGVPAHNPSAPSPPPASFSSLTPPSYGQQSQIRQPIQGMGMTGTLGTSPSMRPTGVSSHQLRPSQPSLRPPQTAASSQPPSSQNFQGHGMLRVSTLGSPASPSPSSSQSPQTQTQGQTQTQTQTQPWLSSGTQGRPPIPTPSPRPQPSSQPFQQRSHVPQQNHPNIPTNQQQPISSGQQSLQSSGSGSGSGQPMELYRPVSGAPRSITHQQQIANQQQITRGAGLASQRPPLGLTQSGGGSQLGAPSKTVNADAEESSSRIISKRSIQELVNQIDPSEKLDPEVEDILVDIAEDFVDSITTFGCNLAKHRKSSTLEAKDILLHLERNWNMTLPGYGGDEIKFYKKPIVSEIHRERLAAVKKSMLAADMASKNPGGPSGGNAKGHLAKGPALTIGSPPNAKIREAA
ncbi:hypothetical protein ABFS83_10G089200 [Erythranthe nasuta]